MISAALFYLIQQRIAEGKPISVVRCGDGEAIVLNGYNDEPKLRYVFERQLGYMPETHQVAQIQQNLINAYKSADIIGLPENKREGLNEYWYSCREILEKNIGEIPKSKITTVDFHNRWLAAGCFANMLDDQENLCYISCRDLDYQLKQRFGIKNIHSFRIAPEMKFTESYTGPTHYPLQLNLIQDWMDTIPVKGSICLVGAGVVGKIYNQWFKERGGISIDIGNVFDAFAGLVTRGKDRGVGVIDNTYKL